MGDRSFCGGAIKSKRGCQLLVVTRSDELSTKGVECLFSEAVRMAHMGGQVLWLRNRPIERMPHEFADDPRRTLRTLRQITFRYFGRQLTEEVAAFCSELHLHKCPDLLLVELTESDVPDDSIHAAIVAMLTDAANWIAQRRKFSTVPAFPVIVALSEAEHKHFDDLFTDCACSLSSVSDQYLSIRSSLTTNTFRLVDNVYTKETPFV